MTAWVKVVTDPLGLAGFALFLVFSYLARTKRNDERRWIVRVAIALAAITLTGGFLLAYLRVNKFAPVQGEGGGIPASVMRQTNQTLQSSAGPGSINVEGVQGDVTVTVDQSTGKVKAAPRSKTSIDKHAALPASQSLAGASDSFAGSISQGPCSSLQIGGAGNSAATNCAPQPRFSSRNIDALTKLLSAYAGSSVNVRVRNADGITSQDATSLLTAFARAGSWRYSGVGREIRGTDIGPDGLPIPEPTGVHIYARTERLGLALSVRDALKAVGVESVVETKESVTGVDLDILVGAI
jgi:hypothetical protein